MSKPGSRVNRAELADVFGVSLPTIDSWVRDGCPFAEKGAKGREWAFETANVHRWLVDRAVADVAAGYEGEIGGITAEEAKRRKAVADAVVAEIGADEALDQVVNRHEAAADVASFCISLRTGLSNACAKFAGRAAAMTGAPEIQALAEKEINQAFDSARDDLAKRWGDAQGA
ncbi:terminase small subunit [Azospirillum doebereinerae]|uniref:Terminase small subunit (DNA packaging protein Nu1) n=1 Tax=Azospirillum doebereinerae TaxID=92933 RepID=A0A433J1A9_9PROT|nr:terminase small subunit [Azospirillum doebereinerae]RUQ63995.1 Terminase small subunit (DNA packaging protein Nu1) [Azospirillum doebereinerae]